ncbi:phage portal protein [Sphingomonas sp. MAH-20]|uniref:Phage portal protein n=1 Tax=Sphingomonas horti TaxID=2682842 RepID=A0A6I4J0F7_9SPHN|nr:MULTISPECIES: phage portal protein [Sphingomonas]MBA2920035.1 phage portal protein [Sphingomonas sp. CGMCC 1.13658]MVO77915.1 phage portal protein [Sphingomonas horti]
MKWFGKKAARGSARPALARGFGMAFGSGEWPRSYEAQVRDAYALNPVAQRAVRLVAESVGSAPIACSEPEVARLIAAQSGGQGLVETVASHLLLQGNAYVEVLTGRSLDTRLSTSLAANGEEVAELFALRPDRVSIEADVRGWPGAYLYRVGEVTQRVEPERLVHVRTFHPTDDHYGLGCLGAAAGAVAIHNAATRWNKGLLDNAARPSGALVYEPQDGSNLSPEQFERLKAELEASFQGAGNAGRPLLLDGGLRWQALSLTPADMDFVSLKAAAAREIALAFGVPPMLLGLPGDNTYANYREANRSLWRLTILPLAAKIYGALAQGLAPWWPGVTVAVDVDRVPELSEDRERLWAMVSGADFLSPEEKRTTVGL